MPLTRLERNKIYETIAASALDPAECTLDQNSNEVKITHANSGSTFKFTFIGTGHVDVYSIQSDVVDGHQLRFQVAYEIDSVTPWIKEWAEEAKVIFAAPDLWAELQSSRELIGVIQHRDFSNEPFTRDEQRQIALQLEAIENEIAERFELNDQQMERVKEKIGEVAEGSKRLGRKDWLVYLMGTVSALVITSIVYPGVGERILIMVIHTLGHLCDGRTEPAQIPPRTIA